MGGMKAIHWTFQRFEESPADFGFRWLKLRLTRMADATVVAFSPSLQLKEDGFSCFKEASNSSSWEL